MRTRELSPSLDTEGFSSPVFTGIPQYTKPQQVSLFAYSKLWTPWGRGLVRAGEARGGRGSGSRGDEGGRETLPAKNHLGPPGAVLGEVQLGPSLVTRWRRAAFVVAIVGPETLSCLPWCKGRYSSPMMRRNVVISTLFGKCFPHNHPQRPQLPTTDPRMDSFLREL